MYLNFMHMIHTIAVKNKVSHVANKIGRKLNTICNVDILLDAVLDDIGMSAYKDSSFWFVFEFDTIKHKYVENQIKYLNNWLKTYNKKHQTKFICI